MICKVKCSDGRKKKKKNPTKFILCVKSLQVCQAHKAALHVQLGL